MDLKNAAVVCLISLFSATLVLLIARALDLQAASRLEPQLAQIADELRLLRKSGGIAAASDRAAESEPVDDGLIVYYFHSNARCTTCRAIESQSHETVKSDFAAQLDSGEVVWKILNYEEPAAADLAKKFEIQIPVVVLARMKGGQIEDWKRLDKVWALVGEKPAFVEYVRDEITRMLETAEEPPSEAPPGETPEIPVPALGSPDIPVPAPPARNPIRQ